MTYYRRRSLEWWEEAAAAAAGAAVGLAAGYLARHWLRRSPVAGPPAREGWEGEPAPAAAEPDSPEGEPGR